MPFNWTEAAFQQVKQMHLDGYSAGAIAQVMGDGMTRNAVIGKLGRMKVTRTGTRTKSTITRAWVPKPRPARPKVAAKQDSAQRVGASRSQRASRMNTTVLGAVDFEPIEADTSPLARDIFTKPLMGSVPVPLIELQHGLCKWSVSGDARPFLFCALPVAPPRLVGGYSVDRVYCPEHTRHGVQQPK